MKAAAKRGSKLAVWTTPEAGLECGRGVDVLQSDEQGPRGADVGETKRHPSEHLKCVVEKMWMR